MSDEQLGFAEAFMAVGVGANRRLDRVSEVVAWAPFERLLEAARPGAAGRPPYPALSMFKALLLQQWYGLSDPGLEEALLDRLSLRRFCGFALDQATPDETTICRFRQTLTAAGLGIRLLNELNHQLDAKGMIVRTGTLIDATIVEAQARAPGMDAAPGAKSPADADADWTRKGGRSYFGYKAHMAVDQGSGLIRKAILTPARVNESEVADDLVCGDETAVYADKAYENKHRRRQLKESGIPPPSSPQTPAARIAWHARSEPAPSLSTATARATSRRLSAATNSPASADATIRSTPRTNTPNSRPSGWTFRIRTWSGRSTNRSPEPRRAHDWLRRR